MKTNDDELFAKLSDVLDELYGSEDSEENVNNQSEASIKSVDSLSEIPDDLLNDIDDLDNIIVLNDENGEEVPFEFLDLIEYMSEEYVVLLPKDESDDAGEVAILKVDENNSEDEESYISVDDEETLMAVFEIFKDKFKDRFNFLD